MKLATEILACITLGAILACLLAGWPFYPL